MKKRSITILMLVSLLLVSAVFGGCAKKKAAVSENEAVFPSVDGLYEFHGTKKGLAWITEAGKSEKLLEGSLKVREENSALIITFEGDIMDVAEGPADVSFTYPVKGQKETFIIHRSTLMKQLECVGVILNTGKNDELIPVEAPEMPAGEGFPGGEGAPGGGAPVDMFSAMGAMSALLFWNNGTVQTMLLKIQSTHNYTYSKEEGLKIVPTDEQIANYGKLWVESYDKASGTYTIGYDLTVMLPGFISNPGTLTVTDAQLQAAFGE